MGKRHLAVTDGKYKRLLASFAIATLILTQSAIPAIASENGEIPPVTSIETGDIQAISVITNEINTNEISGPEADANRSDQIASDTSGAIPSETDTSIPPQEESSTPDPANEIEAGTVTATGSPSEADSEGNGNGTIGIAEGNEAEVSNSANLTATSGDNLASSSTSQASIVTGKISILSIIENFINNNFSGNGKAFFINIFERIFRTIDLSGFDDSDAGNGSQPLFTGNGAEVAIDNSASIENKVILTAETGENVITSDGGGASISTGDIEIANDIINIANMNIVGDEWFFAVVNIMGDLEGDLILPAFENASSAPQYLKEEAENSKNKDTELIIANDNFASIANDIKIDASTGGNSAVGGSAITTGNVSIESHIFNLINYDIVADSWKYARINIYGEWHGIIEGLPPGYGYTQDEEGIIIYNDFLDDYSFYRDYSARVESHNSATASNEVLIKVNTGNNAVSGATGSEIETGDIAIRNNILNMANLNIFGNSWEFSLVNVFGRWNGNLAFGRPELWIKQVVDIGPSYKEGDLVTFKIFFGNAGDAPANNVRIRNTFNNTLLAIEGRAAGSAEEWPIGSLAPNSQGSISFTAKVGYLPYGDSLSANTAHISSTETDRNYANNSATGKIRMAKAYRSPIFESQVKSITAPIVPPSAPLSLTLVKSNDAGKELRAGDLVKFTIIITNNDVRPLSKAVLYDTMTDEKGKIFANKDEWHLETVYPGETIAIDYTMEISASMPNGIYINNAVLEGSNSGTPFFAYGSSIIKVAGQDSGLIAKTARIEETMPRLIKVTKIITSSATAQARAQEQLSSDYSMPISSPAEPMTAEKPDKEGKPIVLGASMEDFSGGNSQPSSLPPLLAMVAAASWIAFYLANTSGKKKVSAWLSMAKARLW